MKKSFPLTVPGKADERVVDAIKHDVRKYVKRERRKPVTTGVDFWDFDCRVGHDQQEPVVTHISAVTDAIDAAAKTEGVTSVYIEIIAKPGVRTPKPKAPDDLAAPAVAPAPKSLAETLTSDDYIAPDDTLL
jgi:hypothetical protein